jgi:ubiquinone/menaquinone biosynthesis C-methylase UbiE
MSFSSDVLAPAPSATERPDAWFEWLTVTRHGGDSGYAAALAPMLRDIRDRLLDNAGLRAGQTIADIGCGDGLAGFGALERQPHSSVTFVDPSAALVARTRELAQRRGRADNCRFVVASATDLSAIPSASIDVVLVRAVLAYIEDKAAAMREFRRILRPAGRISIVDPIFADNAFMLAALAASRRPGARDAAARYAELLHRCRSAHYPDTIEAIRRNPLTNYNERDLFALLVSAGFVDVHLRLHIDAVRAPAIPWPAFLASAPYAGVPTVGEILERDFSPAERREFEQLFRANVVAGTALERNINAYLFATCP